MISDDSVGDRAAGGASTRRPSTRSAPTSVRWTTSAVLWILVLTIMSGFQLWRGAYVDGVLFAALVAVLIVDRATGGRIHVIHRPIEARRSVVFAVTFLLGTVLVLAPRHGTLNLVTMVVVGLGVLFIAWAPPAEARRPSPPPQALRRSMYFWSILGVGFCVWEALAFIFATTMPQGIDGFPTISVLLDPIVEWMPTRIIFVALWLLGGLALLEVWRRR